MIRTTRTRRGVTLVEMMVAAAMCIMGMALLTYLYQAGLDNFRGARARADLAAQERMALTILTRDLKAPHFADEDNKPNRGQRLSDQRMDLLTISGTTLTGWTPPRGGYFRAGTNNPSYDGGGNGVGDTDGFLSSRSADFLQFTVILPGGPNHQTFSAEIPAGGGPSKQYYSTVAEVAYFVVAAGTTPGGTQLYDLYRRQRICVPTSDYVQAYNAPASDPQASDVMSVGGGQIKTLADLTIPQGYPNSFRIALSPLAAPSPRIGDDKLMSNVISFEVKYTGTAGAALGTAWPRPFPTNSDYPYDLLPFDNAGGFDTFSQSVANWNASTNLGTNSNRNGIMKPIRITGAQIRVRGFDQRTRTTRQTTVVVDL